MLAVNYLYELDAWCTSIVFKLNNGTLMHARGFDFYFPDEMKKVIYIGRFYMGDTFLFEGDMFAGNIAVPTAIKPGAFSLSVNERGLH